MQEGLIFRFSLASEENLYPCDFCTIASVNTSFLLLEGYCQLNQNHILSFNDVN